MRSSTRRTNLIPLAGEGRRFREAGFVLPKPLIPVDGVPMVVRAAQSMPPADHWVFIVRQDHVSEYGVDEVLKKNFPGATIVVAVDRTEGQAQTCLLAQTQIDPEIPLTIAACDNALVYDSEKFEHAMRENRVDAYVWTFRNYPYTAENPHAYGWVVADIENRIERVSVKQPISQNPLQDHAIVGAFTFRKARYFFENARRMIQANRRVQNEFYVDECMAVMVEQGLRVHLFEEEKFVCWGTPQDLAQYEYWQGYFRSHH